MDKDESKLVAKCEEIKQETGGEVVPVVADVAKVCSRLLQGWPGETLSYYPNLRPPCSMC